MFSSAGFEGLEVDFIMRLFVNRLPLYNVLRLPISAWKERKTQGRELLGFIRADSLLLREGNPSYTRPKTVPLACTLPQPLPSLIIGASAVRNQPHRR